MQAEYQSPESRVAAIEDSYSYTEAVSRQVSRSHRANRIPSELFRYRVIKRCADVFLVLLSVPLTLLVLGIVAVMVTLSSPGPILYSHRRIRKNGAFFSMWKFRTMCVDSAEVLEEYLARNPKARTEWNETHKLRNDPRITPIGLFLRRYSLDELPQLWNVLAGQMSLVGPRPIVEGEIEKYGEVFDLYTKVRPGVTGLWQVSGRNNTSYQERIEYDEYYLKNWSVWLDVYILGRTIKAVLLAEGAY